MSREEEQTTEIGISTEKKVMMMEMYKKLGSTGKVVENWKDGDPPSVGTILFTYNKFKTTGSVLPDYDVEREKHMLTEEFLQELKEHIHKYPSLSVRKRAKELNVSKSSLNRAIIKLGFH